MAAEAGVSRVAVESSAPYGVVEKARSGFSGEIVPITDWIEGLRAVKDAAEIARIARRSELTDDGVRPHPRLRLAGHDRARDRARARVLHARATASEGVAFAPIVASGPNSARPHAHPGRARVSSAGDFLKLDFGARVDGYCADMTRTVVIGTAERPAARDLRGGARGEPGRHRGGRARACRAARSTAAARAAHRSAGFGEHFRHGLGHGVGLEVHELPGRRAAQRRRAAARAASSPSSRASTCPGSAVLESRTWWWSRRRGHACSPRSTKDLIEL